MKYRSDGAYSCRTELPSERLVAGHPPGIADCLPLPVSPSRQRQHCCSLHDLFFLLCHLVRHEKCSEITDRRAGYIFQQCKTRANPLLFFPNPAATCVGA
jgi:hypothetical protein